MLNKAGVNTQKGIALLIFTIVIALAAITFFISTMSTRDMAAEKNVKTAVSLKNAKRALLAYAANYPEITGSVRGPGYLPCPDLDNDGLSTVIGCNPAGENEVGRFPWATVGSGDLRDGANERLWYAVSDTFDYTNSPAVNKINTQTSGNLTLRDNNNNILFAGTTDSAVVAVIIAPGESLQRTDITQDRSEASGDPNDPVNYLDTAFGEDNATFEHGTLNGFINGEVRDGNGRVIVNDTIEVITYDEIMDIIHRRVAGELSNALSAYNINCGSYPEASVFDPTKAAGLYTSDAGVRQGHLPVDSADWIVGGCANGVLPGWVAAEEWHKVSYYHVAASIPCVPADCLTINGTNPLVNDADAIMMFAGRDLAASRPSTDMNDYYENENADFDRVYNALEPEDSVWVMSP
jgi:hypothetical protein